MGFHNGFSYDIIYCLTTHKITTYPSISVLISLLSLQTAINLGADCLHSKTVGNTPQINFLDPYLQIHKKIIFLATFIRDGFLINKVIYDLISAHPFL